MAVSEAVTAGQGVRHGPRLRPAIREDAAHLARLVNIAGEGLPHCYWSRIDAAGEGAWAVGRGRAARDSGGFSWRNALVAERAGAVAAAVVSYPVAAPEEIDEATPALFRPLIELENLATGTRYVNVLATYPPYRGFDLASALLGEVSRLPGPRRLSLIVNDANLGARRLYARRGFRELARRPIVKDDWVNPGRDWILMATG